MSPNPQEHFIMHKNESWILWVRNLDAVRRASVCMMSVGRTRAWGDFSIWGWHLGRDGQKAGLSWDTWPERLPGGPSSMAASASGWTFHCSSVLLCAKGNLHGLYDPTSKVTWHHFCCTLLVNALTSPLDSKEAALPRPSMGGHQMSWSC